MKHKMRDAMNAVLTEACDALPGSDAILNASRTRAGTALATLLSLSIRGAYRKSDDSVAMAHAVLEHGDFPAALGVVTKAYEDTGSASAQNSWMIAGVAFESNYHGVTLHGDYNHQKLSHAEDMLYSYGAMPACTERVDDLIGIFREELMSAMPDLDVSNVRVGVNQKDEQSILHDGWDEQCVFGEQAFAIGNGHFAHCELSDARQFIQRAVRSYGKRREHASLIVKQKDAIRQAIGDAIARLAPDIPLNVIDIEIRDRWGNMETNVVFEGTGFDLALGRVVYKMQQGLDHYIQHSLPGIIAAQRTLRARMDGQDPANVLIEEPFARLLMQKHGEDWTNKVAEIMSVRSGARDIEAGWSAKMTQGVLRASFAIGEKARWNHGTLSVYNALPEVVMMQLPGRLLSNIVEHAVFGPNARIVSVNNAETYERLPNGTYGKVFSHVEMRTDVPSLRIGDFQEQLAKAA